MLDLVSENRQVELIFGYMLQDIGGLLFCSVCSHTHAQTLE